MLHGSRLLEKKRIIACEEASPVVDRVLDLLLRGGVYGLLEFQEHELPKELEGASRKYKTSSSKQVGKGVQRINPECLRTVLKRCGVVLCQEDYRLLLLAYSDAVGFVLAEALVEALSPLRRLPAQMLDRISLALKVYGGDDNNSNNNEVTCESVMEAFLPALLAPTESYTVGSPSNVLDERLRADLIEAKRCFAAEKFPEGGVPLRAVRVYVATLLFFYFYHSDAADGAEVGSVVMSRLEAIARANPPLLVSTAAADAHSMTASFNLGATRSVRKFERYEERDRLDEWLHGREERDARDSYMKHVVGYAGHLPGFQHYFGRTFHVIEEDLPQLTKPKEPKLPLPLDAFGPAIKLKHSRMSEHHFKLS